LQFGVVFFSGDTNNSPFAILQAIKYSVAWKH